MPSRIEEDADYTAHNALGEEVSILPMSDLLKWRGGFNNINQEPANNNREEENFTPMFTQ